MKLIIGLGNPEDNYAATRHNLGFEVLDKYVSSIMRPSEGPVSWEADKKFKSHIVKISPQLLAVKPQTYMNKSGLAVKLLADYYKVAAEDIIILHDELDLPLGKIKVRIGGAAAGHHGVESVIESLNSDKFIRVRLGIGNLRTKSAEHKGQTLSAEKFVLEGFMHSEKSKVKHMTKQAMKALEILLEKGLIEAQNQYN